MIRKAGLIEAEAGPELKVSDKKIHTEIKGCTLKWAQVPEASCAVSMLGSVIFPWLDTKPEDDVAVTSSRPPPPEKGGFLYASRLQVVRINTIKGGRSKRRIVECEGQDLELPRVVTFNSGSASA